jgi:hypothetical protein
MSSITVITPASFAPVTTVDMLSFLRLNDTSESALIASLIDAATDKWTNDTSGHVLCSQTLRLYLDKFPGQSNCSSSYDPSIVYSTLYPAATIRIPRGPVSSVTTVEYLDTTATWQTLTGWTADTTSTPARIILPSSLPQLHASQVPAVRVTFVVGYANAASIPATALVGIRLAASHWYDQRGAYTEGEMKELPQGWAALTARFALGLSGDINR